MHLTVSDAAKLLCTAEKQVYRWIDTGELPCDWLNGNPRFSSTELLEWATARRIPFSLELFQNAEGKANKLPSLCEALRIGGVYYDVEGTDSSSVLRAVVARMPWLSEEKNFTRSQFEASPSSSIDRETLLQILIAREASGSTGVGEGIAIPHVRHPIALQGNPASLTLCFLQRPVDFSAPDGQLVHTIFSLISPHIQGHLQLLAKLSVVLQDTQFRAAVLSRAPVEKILQEAQRLEVNIPQESND